MAVSRPEATTTGLSAGQIPWWAYAMLALGVACSTLGIFLVKWAHVPGPSSAFYRLAFASMVVLPWWLAQRPRRLDRAALPTAALAGLFFAVDIVLWNSATLETSAANTSLFANSAPLWVGLGALVLGERLRRRFWLGMLIALVGAVFVLGGGQLPGVGGGRGDLLALAAGAAYAGYLLTSQRVRARLDAMSAFVITLLVGLGVTFVLCLALGAPLTGFSGQTWALLVGLGLISQATGSLAISYALGHIKATLTSVSMLLQTALTALLGVPLLGEPLSLAQIGGGLLLLLGVYLVSTRQN